MRQHELHVTQAAVSHQIKSLEGSLGVPVFRRLNRALMLTDAGQALFPAVNEALDIMATAVDRLHRARPYRRTDGNDHGFVCGTWLVPRLGRFRKAHPEIDLRCTTSDTASILPVTMSIWRSATAVATGPG